MSVAARAGGGSRLAPFGLLGDERLARLTTAGHPRAFAVVYERHHQALYRYCRSILRDDADAQDALQSTFAAAFAALGRDRRDAPIRPWLFRIAHNESVSALRRRRPTTDLSAASDWHATSVEDQAARRADVDVLLRDLRELNERQRSALVMRELSGLSHEEIAIALGTSVGAAKQTIYEARRSLFEFAEGRAVPCDEIRRMISDADGRLLRSRRVRAHLRACPGCAAFAAAIPERSQELRALVPALPAMVGAAMLGRVAGPGAAHSAGSGLGGLAAGAAGKAAGSTLTANALAGVAVVASATVGVTIGVDRLGHGSAHAVAGRAAVSAVHSVSRGSGSPTAVARRPAASPLIRSGTGAASQAVSSAPPPGVAHRARPGPPSPRGRSAPATASRSIVVPEHASPAAPGHSASAPGHIKSTTRIASGNSASAPGHTKSARTIVSGNSASARGHTKSARAIAPENSASAPGKSDSIPRQTKPPGATALSGHKR